MKDVKIAKFVELIIKGKTAIEAAKESDIISNHTFLWRSNRRNHLG